MNTTASQYLVGIDLGTTHTVVAYAAINDPENIRLLRFSNWLRPAKSRRAIAAGVITRLWGEFSDAAGFLTAKDGFILGEAACVGREIAKPFVDQRQELVIACVGRSYGRNPAQATRIGYSMVSPLEASTSYRHRSVGATIPQAPLSRQSVVITVPASFDSRRVR